MNKKVSIKIRDYTIELITNGAEDFENIVICFHGFNGDRWGDAYSGLKGRLASSLVVSFDSCGHGESEISSEQMRLDLILEEIDVVVKFLASALPGKSIILVAGSYGAYRVFNYLIKYKPEIKKVIYVNPAFRMLRVLEILKEFKYTDLGENEKVVMKRSLGKFVSKAFLDDLFENDLYATTYDIKYDAHIVVGNRDSLIPIQDTVEIAGRYNYSITYIDEDHNFENKESWNVVADIIKESV